MVAVCNYLNEEEIIQIRRELGTKLFWSANQFIAMLAKYFEFERLRTDPLVGEDYLLYNYLAYDCPAEKGFKFVQPEHFKKVRLQFRRTRLINQYEREVIIPQLLALKAFDDIVKHLE